MSKKSKKDKWVTDIETAWQPIATEPPNALDRALDNSIREDNFIMRWDTHKQKEPIRFVEELPIGFSDKTDAGVTHDRCARCDLVHVCELMNEYRLLQANNPGTELPSYVNVDRNHCAVPWHFWTIHCGSQRVSEGIGDSFKVELYRYSYNLVTNHDEERKWPPERWSPKIPVFISAPTGRGKNYFIENDVLPYVYDLNLDNSINLKVLIVSNRIALRLQMKDRLNRGGFGQDSDDIDQTTFPYQSFRSENRGRKYPADVITYQGLLNKAGHFKKVQADGRERYIFVVCDEAHFFTSDGMFNPHSEKILTEIVATFQDAVRVYMSATPYECLDYIQKHESKGYKGDDIQLGLGLFYHFKRDYSYLAVRYYSHEDELKDIIVHSVNISKENWMVFIDSIKRGEKFKAELDAAFKKGSPSTDDEGTQGLDEDKPSKEKQKVYAVAATSKDDSKYQRMVFDEELVDGTKVLITTSVLDNGVNFRGIHNIVVSDVSRVKCLQMVGRARVEGGDRVTLYVQRFDEKLIKDRITDLEEQRHAYHLWDLAHEMPTDYSDGARRHDHWGEFRDRYYPRVSQDGGNGKPEYWFARDRAYVPGALMPIHEIYFNEITRPLVDTMIERYQSILEEMKATDDGQVTATGRKLTGQKYLEYQLSWFEKTYKAPTQDDSNGSGYSDSDITLMHKDRDMKSLIGLLESYATSGKHMHIDAQTKFSEEITPLLDSVFPGTNPNKRDHRLNKINKFLEAGNIGYRVESNREKTGEKKTSWVVVRSDGDPDKSKES